MKYHANLCVHIYFESDQPEIFLKKLNIQAYLTSFSWIVVVVLAWALKDGWKFAKPHLKRGTGVDMRRKAIHPRHLSTLHELTDDQLVPAFTLCGE